MTRPPALYLESALLLLSCFLVSPSLAQFGNCPESTLGSNRDTSFVGLVPEIVGGPVQIQNSSILCLSSGTQRSTYRSVSVLIQYVTIEDAVDHTSQFAFICNISGEWMSNPNRPIDIQPTATFGMDTEIQCSYCNYIPEVSQSSYCIACNPSCPGAGLCYGGPNGGGRTCCSYYTANDQCTTECMGLIQESDFSCVTPEFIINRNRYPAPIGDPTVYVYDPRRGSQEPILIICPLTEGDITWSSESPLGSTRLNVTDSQSLTSQGVLIVSFSGPELILSSIFTSNVSLLVCANMQNQFTLRIVKDNPYLSVESPLRLYLLPGETFKISLIVAYTLELDVTLTPTNDQDVVVMVMHADGSITEGSSRDVGAVLTNVNSFRRVYLFNTSQLSSSSSIMFSVNVNNTSAMSQVVDVEVTDLPLLPAVLILTEGDQFLLNCTPTTIDLRVPFSLTLNGNQVVESGFIVSVTSISSANAGRYVCSLGNSIRRTSYVVVLPKNNTDGLFLTDNNVNFVVNEHVVNDFIQGSLGVRCFGRSGNGKLEWSTESIPGYPQEQLREKLQDNAGKIGTSYFTIGEANYTLEYVITSNPTVHHSSLRISTVGTRISLVNYFTCHSLESSLSRNVTITNNLTFIDNYRTNFNPVVGQMLNIRYRLAVSKELSSSAIFPPRLMFNQSSLINGERLVQNTENPQLYEVMIDVVTNANMGVYTLTLEIPDVLIRMLDTVITVATPSLVLTLYRTEVDEGGAFMVDCTPSNNLVQVDWFKFESRLNNNPEYNFTPPLLRHRMMAIASDRTQGTFMCSVRGSSPLISQSFTIQVRLACPSSVAAGIFWKPSFFGDVQTFPCSRIDPSFRNAVMASRACGDNHMWSDIDFSGCSLRPGLEPFLLLWFTVEEIISDELTSNLITNEISSSVSLYGSIPINSNSVQVIPNSATLTLYPDGLQYDSVERRSSLAFPILYRASLSVNGTQVNVSAIRSMFVRMVSFIGEVYVIQETPYSAGVVGFQAAEDCQCFPYHFEVIERRFERQVAPTVPAENVPAENPFILTFLHQLCVGVSISPCDCSVGNNLLPNSGGADLTIIPGSPCQCGSFFVGDGQRCVQDSDKDGYPDKPLSTCVNQSQQLLPNYCIEDTCPTIFNIPQSNRDICTSGDCPMEVDSVFGLVWGFTSAGKTVIQFCGSDYIGNATRMCRTNKTWEEPDVSQCIGQAFAIAMELGDQLGLMGAAGFSIDVLELVLDTLSSLVEETTPNVAGTSQLPADLEATSSFISNAVDYLILGLDGENQDVEAIISGDILTIISNVITTDNLPGSRQLSQKKPKNTFARDVLGSTERYALFLSKLLDNSGAKNTEMLLVRPNIVLNAMVVSVDDGLLDVTFPSDNIREMKTSSNSSVLDRIHDVSVVLPVSLIRQRATNNNVKRVQVANIVFQNLDQFLPSNLNNDSDPQKPASLIISSQVQQQSGDQDRVLPDPVALTFTTLNKNKDQNFSCVFWDFEINQGLGGWSDVGLSRGSVITSGTNDAVVQCFSDHLTSFAVLVNVGGGSVESLALSIVSYIGVVLSLLCLIATIIFFLTFGMKLFTAVHNFVHLNLAIALLLAYSTFVIGIELAAKDKIACQFMAALLHYLFLAVFFWMLCEGVMLYLMLVVVFSTLSKKWWFFLLLGWLPPLFFVVVGLASVPDQYGVYKNGNLKYCFLASGNGKYAIWAFAAPMLGIILVNTVLLVLVLVSLVRSRGGKQDDMKVKEGKHLKTVVFALKAVVILFPLLGVTWLIGFFAVEKATHAFAWLFTIFVSLHGVFFFVLHVLRNDKIWGRFKRKYHILETSKPTQSSSSTHGQQYQVKMTNTAYTSVSNTYSTPASDKKLLEASQEFKAEADEKVPLDDVEVKEKDVPV